MTEKKTFKNQRVSWQYESMMRKYGWCVEDEPCFFADEWDMEVTFTKKEEPLHINHLVQDADKYIGRIVAIQGDKAWVHYTTNDLGGTENFDGIEYVKDLKRVG